MPRLTVQRIVADGGLSSIKTLCSSDDIYIRTWPQPTGLQSFYQNLRVALAEAKGEVIIFMEDDDWYSADYLEQIVSLFLDSGTNIAGEGETAYWNWRYGLAARRGNLNHAALFQTAVRGEMKERMLDLLQDEANGPYLDLRLWRSPVARRSITVPARPLSVGIKGLPGREGFSDCHRSVHDFDLPTRFAEEWLGEDFDEYMNFSELEVA